MSTRRSVCASGMRLFFWTLLLTCTGAAHAARFDERIKAPHATSAADFKRSVRDYFAAYERQYERDAEDASSLIRNRTAYEAWADTEWQLVRSLDDGMPLGDLSEFGFEREEDGSYTVKVKDHPQWMAIDLALATLRVPSIYDAYARDLRERGFRDQDLAALKNYLDSNNWESAAFAQNKPLTESFALRAQARHRAKRAIDPEETMAFVYQRNRNSLEARRAWAVGLLDTLDKQRQRILLSYFGEFDSTRSFGPPESGVQQHLERTVAPLISGEYIQALKQEEMRVRQ